VVEVYVWNVLRLTGPEGEEHLLVLAERAGARLLPLAVGPFEGQALRRALAREQAPRPLVHDLLTSVVARLGGRLHRVVIHDLRQDTYFAVVEVDTPGGVVELDARPSDGVVLALKTGCPIWVDESVLARAAVTHEPWLRSQPHPPGDPRG
jgi:bifunctional DNase/RNase